MLQILKLGCFWLLRSLNHSSLTIETSSSSETWRATWKGYLKNSSIEITPAKLKATSQQAKWDLERFRRSQPFFEKIKSGIDMHLWRFRSHGNWRLHWTRDSVRHNINQIVHKRGGHNDDCKTNQNEQIQRGGPKPTNPCQSVHHAITTHGDIPQNQVKHNL